MARPFFGTNFTLPAMTSICNGDDSSFGSQPSMDVNKLDQALLSKIRGRNYKTALSPYAAELATYIGQQQSIKHAKLSADAKRPLHKKDTKFSDTEKRNSQKDWMITKLWNDGWTTKTGVHVFDFVKFEDLDEHNEQHKDAYNEAQIGRLPTKLDFYGIFAVMCHLNDKAIDPDKLCMPRNLRIDAIREELNNPGTTDPPEGYASENKACWSFEVKNNWTILPGFPPCVAQKNKDGSTTAQYPLESAYYIIALNHIGRDKNGQIKHRSRDDTQKWVRGLEGNTEGNESFTTQIIKDFVAACPGCNANPKRASRIQGTETTRSHGGNKEKRKESNGSPKKRRAESDPEIDASSPSKKQAIETPSQVIDNQYPGNANPYNKISNNASNIVQQQDQQSHNLQSPDNDRKIEKSEESSSINLRSSKTDKYNQFNFSQQFDLNQDDQLIMYLSDFSTSLNFEDPVYKDSRWTHNTADSELQECLQSLVNNSTSSSTSSSTHYEFFNPQQTAQPTST
jgi:hypothetical protein